MKFSFLIGLFLFSFASLAQSNNFEVRLVIASEQVNCGQDVVYPCFQAKKETDPYWTFTIDAIEDFEFETGFEYVLDLKIEHIADSTQPNGVWTKYSLVNIVEKTEELD
jgi:hypothetical protein